jgi:hypothetical protein
MPLQASSVMCVCPEPFSTDDMLIANSLEISRHIARLLLHHACHAQSAILLLFLTL